MDARSHDVLRANAWMITWLRQQCSGKIEEMVDRIKARALSEGLLSGHSTWISRGMADSVSQRGSWVIFYSMPDALCQYGRALRIDKSRNNGEEYSFFKASGHYPFDEYVPDGEQISRNSNEPLQKHLQLLQLRCPDRKIDAILHESRTMCRDRLLMLAVTVIEHVPSRF